jgi:hypothetical protein
MSPPKKSYDEKKEERMKAEREARKMRNKL